jgi:hypothetical protein
MDGLNCGLVHEYVEFRMSYSLGGVASKVAILVNSGNCLISLKGWNMTAQGNALGKHQSTISPVGA